MALDASSTAMKGLVIFVLLSMVSSYMQQLPSRRLILAQSMYLEPRTDRDQSFNREGVKVAGTVLASLLFFPVVSRAAIDTTTGISDIVVTYDGVAKPIGEYLGKKGTLIINVASQCALTPQYEELVNIYNKYKQDGFTILAFPCNQFGSQEPQPVERVRKDMKSQFGVEFPIFDKIEVNGGGAAPLYNKLKAYDGLGTSTDSVKKISWNFEKFLINPAGMPVRRYVKVAFAVLFLLANYCSS
jgi:glutathione peroxidase